MAIKWTYESVKEYISNTGCTLLNTSYKNAKTKLKIKCRLCGKEYETTFDSFLHTKTKCCRHCALSVNHTGRYTIEEINEIVKNTTAKLISTSYKGVQEMLEFECKCGERFFTTWSSFNNHKRHTCIKCSYKNRSEKVRNVLTGKVVGELTVLEIDEDKTNKTGKVYWKCICSCGREKSISSSLLSTEKQKSCGCKAPINKYFTLDDVKKKTSEISDCKVLSTEYISAHKKLTFLCSCGKEFQRSWANFTNKNKRKCPSCVKKESSLEREVREVLEQMGEEFFQQHIFDECRNEMVLPFDFYIQKKNIAIEVDGIHHFEPIDYYGGEEQFKKQKIRDEIKNNFCKDNGIKLIRIPYWEVKNASIILQKELQ